MTIHMKILLGTLSLICRPRLFTAYTTLPTNHSENRAFHTYTFKSITPGNYIVYLSIIPELVEKAFLNHLC